MTMHLDKPVLLDIETSSLEADAGVVVGVGLIDEKGESHYLESRRSGEERELLVRLVKRLDAYSMIVTWNGRSFDLPFLVTRMLKHRLDPRPILGKEHLDLAELVKFRLRLTFTYLDHVCEFFGIEKKRNPMGMDVPGLYLRALEGDRMALGRIKEHCLDDLRATRKLYLLLGPLLQAQHAKDRGAGLAAENE